MPKGEGKMWRKLKNKPFIRNVFIVASGTAAAQAAALMLLPLITRLYGPEAYGLLGAFVAITAILTPLAALTFPTAIVLPKEDAEAVSIVRLSLKMMGLVAVLLAIVLVFFLDEFSYAFHVESLSGYLYLLPVIVFLTGLMEVMNQWLIRTGQYKIIAKAVAYQSILSYGIMVMIGLFHPVAAVLIVVTVFRTGITAVQMYLKMKFNQETVKINLKEASLSSAAIVKKYRDFPVYRAPEVLISSVSYNIPVLLLTTFISPAAAGFYVLGRTALDLPSQLIGKAVGDVFYPRIANASVLKESLVDLINKATLTLSAIGIIPFGLVIIAGPELFTLVFGSDWLRAGEYARWIAFMSLTMFISRPAIHALPVINAQRFQLFFTMAMTLIRFGALYYGLVVMGDDLLAVMLFCTFSSVMYMALIVMTVVKSRNYMILNY